MPLPLSIVDLYRKVLPRTNCRDCGFPTCFAFASMVVSEKLPIANCPHLAPDLVERVQAELDEQYAQGKWTKKDLAADALKWARERASSMTLEDVSERIGGKIAEENGGQYMEIPYFTDVIHVSERGISRMDGTPLGRWEQVFLYNHMAQGGRTLPKGIWKALEEIPNTVSKIVSMREQVEMPLVEHFRGRREDLRRAAHEAGGKDLGDSAQDADLAVLFTPLPRIPVLLLFWDELPGEPFGAKAKLLFDVTVTEHLDIESIIFLSERLRQILCEAAG